MPMYTYICQECNTQFEAFASIQKKEAGWKPQCPKCGSQKTRQTFKAVMVMKSTSQPPTGGGCCSSC